MTRPAGGRPSFWFGRLLGGPAVAELAGGAEWLGGGSPSSWLGFISGHIGPRWRSGPGAGVPVRRLAVAGA
ncbi:hypothetical protein NDU88_002021 [Pleurodeles waltl]|uniref:Uncharacterized protein n=1 Tax=Pleurodeles waltl TaxID=8319 RepID=A0AAV7MLE8_PLEWA|nr:hypothetical protein NDU88_002021 [Pleurodeles waltl]